MKRETLPAETLEWEMRERRTAFFFFALVVFGCTGAQLGAQNPDAELGSGILPPNSAGQLFTEVCLTTAPSFEQVPQTVAKRPFVQHSETGTYFHKHATSQSRFTNMGVQWSSGLR